MTRAVNDATLQKAGDIYQYLIALRDCFELNDGDTLQIETNGDVSIINDVGGRFQREVKHHFGNTSISDRDIDFWKTLANFCKEYPTVNLSMKKTGGIFHDRFIVLDYGTADERVFLCGASSKDAGARVTSIVEDYGVSKYAPVIATLLKNPTLI